MRIELPEGYVPPQPTHPHYGYVTPEEQAERETAEHEAGEGAEGQGIVPGVDPEAGMPPAAPSPWAPEPEVVTGPEAPERRRPGRVAVDRLGSEPVAEPEAPDEATRPAARPRPPEAGT